MEENKEEVLTPHEHKTYEREPLYTVIYAETKEGRPISYQRIYNKSYAQIKRIQDAITSFYGWRGEGRDGKRKLNLSRLSELTGINASTLRPLLIQMASAKKIIRKKGNKWIPEYSKPLCILQQKAKHIEQSLWGKRCPLYVLPFDEKYYQRKE